MSIGFRASNPTQLLANFKTAIKEGKITTWSCTANGDFTHKSDNWKNKAWLRPTISFNELAFKIIAPEGGKVTTVVYGYYHGHIIETFLNHFDQTFQSASASAQPTDGDIVSAA